jgi:hypothetical protein
MCSVQPLLTTLVPYLTTLLTVGPRKSAFAVYGKRKHLVSLIVWPAATLALFLL